MALRTFGNVDNKLEEADFFLERISSKETGWYEVRFFFSAFVSSCRSVSFSMQASLKGLENFDEWYDQRRSELRENSLARFFLECRNENQKVGSNQIMGGAMRNGGLLFFFGPLEDEQKIVTPTIDVVSACEEYMKLMCELVDRAYQDFGLAIDPDQIYTPEGLQTLELTLEDVEAELGFPRGYTDIEWPNEDKFEQRLSLLARNIPRSSVKPLLRKFLKRKLTYRDSRYSLGNVPSVEPRAV